LKSIAFCCISTGVFGYPQEPAAEVALKTVKEWLSEPANAEAMDLVVFNVFTEKDHEIYSRLTPTVFN
jgi:O-acetyl-ADP-ribose deacetylase (regulator of RNase III)